MFISSRLSGRFLKDKNIKIVFKTPSTLYDEILRRTRQAISTQQYHEYFSYLKTKAIKVKLFDQSISDDYVWGGTTNTDIFSVWLRLNGFKSKMLIIIHVLIKQWAKFRAYITVRRLKMNAELDYWKVSR